MPRAVFLTPLILAFVLITEAECTGQCQLPGLENFESAVASPTAVCSANNFGSYPSGWTLDPSSTNAWRPRRGATTSPMTGPRGDHTTGTGIYLFTEASCTPGTWTAILVSPCFDMMGVMTPTLEFWTHMFGSSMGTLSVEEFDGTNWNQIWSQSGDQGDSWQFVRLGLTPQVNGESQLRFIGVRGPGLLSDMAIDDIKVDEPTPVQWETNSDAGFLDIDGVQAQPLGSTAAIVNATTPGCSGTAPFSSSQMRYGSNIVGTSYDVALSSLPAVPGVTGMGTLLSDGQIINVDMGPGLTWLLGGGGPQVAPLPGAFPGSLGGEVTIPFLLNVPTDITAQAAFTDVTSPTGFTLSQASEFHLMVISPQNVIQGPASSPGSVPGDLVTSPTCWTTSGIPFFGTSYTQIQVASSGRVLFGPNADIDVSPTIAESLIDEPFCGLWTDLEPDAQSSIQAFDLGGGLFQVACTNLPYAGETTSGPRLTTSVTFDSQSGVITFDGLDTIAQNPISAGASSADDSLWLGLSPGQAGPATNPGFTTFAVGVSGSSLLATDMIYDFHDAFALGAGLPASLVAGTLTSIIFTPLPTGGYSWQGF